MMFNCPVCKRVHSVQNNYDNADYICSNNVKTFQDMVPEDQLEKTNPLMNRASTREDVQRDATIVNIKPDYRTTGEKISQLKENY